jgi:phosphohistidine phosphatase
MKRELLVLRHGKSDWSKPVDDFHRPLKKRGRKNARQMGSWLAEQGLVPDYLISSPAFRALATARLAAKAMQFSVREIRQEKAVYDADLDRLLQILRAVPKSSCRILLVGHNQGIEQLVQYLAAGKIPVPENGKLMPTAALARFQVARPWKELDAGVVEFLEIIRPRELNKEK